MAAVQLAVPLAVQHCSSAVLFFGTHADVGPEALKLRTARDFATALADYKPRH